MRARGLAPETPVVILSCKSDEKALVRAWELGAVEFLLKPIDPYVLAEKIAAIVESSATTVAPPQGSAAQTS
jgi:DNA-binding response OmpR family regulator